jgi:GDP-D-mannose dehydratase
LLGAQREHDCADAGVRHYVEAMWLMLQKDTAEDYVIATNQTNSVRECVEVAFDETDLELLSR